MQPASNGFPGQGGSPNGFPSSSGNQFSGGGGGGLGGFGGGGLSGAQPTLPAAAPAAQVTVNGTPDGSLLITSDPVTNRLLVLGEPRIIDQVQTLVTQLDQYQPQVDIEFTMVSLTDDESRDVSVVGRQDLGCVRPQTVAHRYVQTVRRSDVRGEAASRLPS